MYPLPEGESTAEKTYLLLSWLTGDASDLAETARMGILSLLLLGSDGAPLKKAVTDAHQSFYKWMPRLKVKRLRRQSQQQVSCIYSGLLLVDYYLLRRTRFSKLKVKH